MSRPLRIEYPGAWHHVMNRGSGRQKIFLDDRDRHGFLSLLGESCQMWGIEVHAFCLLGNHYHLLLHTPRGNLSRSMRHVDGVYTQRFNRRYRRDGALFRGRFKAILVDADSYLLEVVRYIHLNPVRAKVVRGPGEYRWSSHRSYLEKRGRFSWLIRGEVLGRFGARWEGAVVGYREFIREGIPSQIERFYGAKRTAAILGTEGFKGWVRGRLSEQVRGDYEISQARGSGLRPRAEQIIGAVKRRYAVRDEALEGVLRGRWNEPRDVAMYLCRRECGLGLKAIGERFSVPVYTTVSMACRRVEGKLREDRRFRKRVEALIQEG